MFAAAIGFSGIAGCSKSDQDTVKDGAFASMEAFLAGVQDGGRNRHQVVFIGIDGGAWDILGPMIDEGELPAFARLKSEGSSGVLRSVPAYISPPAWATMFTGYSPENSGIYTFGKWMPDERRFASVSSADVAVPLLWDVASAAGKRVAVTNVPMTYPVRPVNGIMVSGLMTPFVYERDELELTLRLQDYRGDFHRELDGKSQSPRLSGRTSAWSRTFVVVYYDTKDDGKRTYDTAAVKIFPQQGQWNDSDDVPVHVMPINTYSPLLRFEYVKADGAVKPVQCSLKPSITTEARGRRSVNFGMIELSPLFRTPTDPDLKMTYPPEFAAEIDSKFGAYINNLNVVPEMLIGKVEDTAAYAEFFYDYDDWDFFTYVFMATDNIQHREGFSGNARSVYREVDRFLARLIEKLPEDVTLIVASDHGFHHYDTIVDLNNYFHELGLIDNIEKPSQDNSLAYHNQWCIYFSDKLLTKDELKKRGVPLRGASPREALIRFLKEKAAEFVDPQSGKPLPIELVEVPSDAAGQPPDMIVTGTYDGYFVESPDPVSRRPGLAVPTDPNATAYHDRGWYHDRDGVFFMWGNRVRAGVDGGTRSIESITPTILYLMGLPLAQDFDGTVMEDLVREEFRTKKHYLTNYAGLTPNLDEDTEELQSHEEKLRSLGYIR
jgi:predicted AlkP superfamily phosphohydrolase/phosphomutase